jgi:trimethylamine--corrinoid protein Co-methyltransferase
MGAMGSLNYFCLDKFIQDCERERETRKIILKTRHDFVVPLYFPEDKGVVRGIREIAEKGGPKYADHTLSNVGQFIEWRKRLVEMAERKVYYPELRNVLEKDRVGLRRMSDEQRVAQMQESFHTDIEVGWGQEE